ncbi:MAG TPA: hypothetical protein ENH82_10370 [bacterium]|nr:hypothetical protein [bacterium]
MKKRIHPSAQIADGVIIEDDVYIGPFCIIGYPAEHKGHWNPEHQFGQVNDHTVVIKKGTILTGHVTIDAGTVRDTVIGEKCFIMKSAHIGHDAIIGGNSIISPHAIIGGHCEIGLNVNFGMGSIIHQRAKVPDECMIGMGAIITKKTDMWKGGIFVGNPAYFLRQNKK